MNKSLFCLVIMLQAYPLTAMRPPVDELRCVPLFQPCANFKDEDIDFKIPDEWKSMRFTNLLDLKINDMDLAWKKTNFWLYQSHRHDKAWGHINYLQEQDPQKFLVTINPRFAQRNQNAFLYAEFKYTNYQEINALIAKIMAIKR